MSLTISHYELSYKLSGRIQRHHARPLGDDDAGGDAGGDASGCGVGGGKCRRCLVAMVRIVAATVMHGWHIRTEHQSEEQRQEQGG